MPVKPKREDIFTSKHRTSMLKVFCDKAKRFFLEDISDKDLEEMEDEMHAMIHAVAGGRGFIKR